MHVPGEVVRGDNSALVMGGVQEVPPVRLALNQARVVHEEEVALNLRWVWVNRLGKCGALAEEWRGERRANGQRREDQ